MNEQAMTIMDGTAEVFAEEFPAPNENGAFKEEDCETIYGPILTGVDASIRVAEQADGWRAGYSAKLPESDARTGPAAFERPLPSRAAAVISAAEDLIAWLSTEKEKGSKRHRRAAEKMQDWALELVQRTAAGEDQRSEEERPAEFGAQDGAGEAGLQAPANLPQAGGSLGTDMVPRLFPLERLRESELNPRQYIPDASVEEMAGRIRQSGFQPWTPIVARPCADGYAEIAAGHRRRLGAMRAGLTEVPCVIRPMTDEEFLDILNFDNSGREDVHPLHEAAGWRTWMERTGKGVMDIAARLGKSKEWVYMRLKYASLIPDAKEAFLRNEFTADHAIRIARRPVEVQKKALAFLKPNPYDGRVPSTRDLDRWLHQSQTVDLAAAPFDREDAMLLAGAGTCGACPKRSGNDPAFEPAEGMLPAVDLCTDPKCYGQKLENHLVRLRYELAAKDEGVHFPLQVSQNYTTRKKGAIGLDSYERVEGNDPNAKTAVVVEGPEVGKVVQVRLKKAEGCGLPTGPTGPTAEQTKTEEEERERKVREFAVRRRILDAVLVKVGGLTRADIEALLLKHFEGYDVDCARICELHGIEADDSSAPEALAVRLVAMDANELNHVVIEAAIIEDLAEWRLGQEPEGLLALAKRYKVDAMKIRAEMEGGTRREVKKAKAAKKSVPAKKAAKPAAAKKSTPKKAEAAKAVAGKKAAKKGGKK